MDDSHPINRKITVKLNRNFNEMIGKSWVALQQEGDRRRTVERLTPSENILHLDGLISQGINDLEQIILNAVQRKRDLVIHTHSTHLKQKDEELLNLLEILKQRGQTKSKTTEFTVLKSTVEDLSN